VVDTVRARKDENSPLQEKVGAALYCEDGTITIRGATRTRTKMDVDIKSDGTILIPCAEEYMGSSLFRLAYCSD
jgi:hypothetical protein